MRGSREISSIDIPSFSAASVKTLSSSSFGFSIVLLKMDHGGGHSMKHDDPNSILLEPGKSGEIIWKFTQKTKLEFACNIPGHYESGMMGPVNFK